ncbi:NDP-hexose 2,3-dehydratase family protein [Saccharothrix sp. Mg75]|uniref:NDP-hexose 2,3-dehydratase family protein n=1 Tax=Saccharothrix sp. Mg75 TaxID=3445357 RepID=UPI003EEC1051
MTAHVTGSSAGSDISARLLRSARRADSPLTPNAEVDAWLERQRAECAAVVHRVPFADVRGWRFAEDTGNLRHDSGKFFSVEGVKVTTDDGTWVQPIIVQPEIGVLGLLVKEFDGVLHFLMQAKFEPGNVTVVQLSPTVQATRSNYTGVHRGASIPHLEHFLRDWSSGVLVDVLQSEQNAWFLHKRNRNMVVETTEPVEHDDRFRWLTLGQVWRLLHRDDVVNMDARTVLSCLPPVVTAARPDGTGRDGAGADGAGFDEVETDDFGAAVLASFRDHDRDPRGAGEVLSWLTDQRSRREFLQERVPLNRGANHGWRRGPDRIEHDSGRFFTVVGVDVRTGAREVASWCQPLIAPVGSGLLALLVRRTRGPVEVLVQAKLDAGSLNGVELAASVHCTPDNYRGLPPERSPLFLDAVLGADPGAIRYDVMQSEEGGRFLDASNRYVVVEVGEDFPSALPDSYRWLSLGRLCALLAHSNYLTVELRSLVACVQTLPHRDLAAPAGGGR